jgi:hypothetical protein
MEEKNLNEKKRKKENNMNQNAQFEWQGQYFYKTKILYTFNIMQNP